MKILVIEDDQELAAGLRTALRDYSVVELAETGDQGLSYLEDEAYDLVILDLGLPDMSGLAICELIRKNGYNMPVLIITASHDKSAVVRLLDAGADDYITKPFRVDELKARVRALARRQEKREPVEEQLLCGDLLLNLKEHYALRNGKRIELRNKEFIILEELMRHPNIVLTRSSLLSKAWDSREDSPNNIVDVHIKNIRDKIDKPFGTHSLQTVHGLGYRIVSKKSHRPPTA